MTNYLLQFGGYVLPTTIRYDGQKATLDLAEVELPRRAGAASQVGRMQPVTINVRGSLSSDTPSDLLALWGTVKANLITGYEKLFAGRDDRYFIAQVESITDSSKDGRAYGTMMDVAITFKADDPFAYDVAGIQTYNFPDPIGAGTVPNDGTADETLPVWTISGISAGAGTVTLTNVTTGESCTLSGTFAVGDTIVLNRGWDATLGRDYTVKWNGTDQFGLLSGQIPMLVPGANEIAVSSTAVAVASVSCQWINRYV